MSVSKFKSAIAEKIATLRKRKGWTQSKLAQALDVHQPDVCDWENGHHEPTLETLVKLADVLGVSVTYFLKTPA